MYESPITLIKKQIGPDIEIDIEKQVYKVIYEYGIDVDKEELLKALEYDRFQYDKGYEDCLKNLKNRITNEINSTSLPLEMSFSRSEIVNLIENIFKEFEGDYE